MSTEALHGALEGLAHLDPEAQWVASETAAAYSQKRREQGKSSTIIGMARAYGFAIANLVAERLSVSAHDRMLSESEAANIGADALVRLAPEQKLDALSRVDLAARFVMAAAKVRAISPKPMVAAGVTEYWPFGQEGGFCNPYKLDAQSS